MDRILALDTSSDCCSVGLSFSGQQTSITNRTPRQHSQKLLVMVEEVLADAGITVNQLDAIAFGRGPGSFTGIRICLSVAQGLAYAADIPLIPVSTLRTIAQGTLRQGRILPQQNLLVAVDARMQEVYWADYRVQFDGAVIPLGEESISPPEIVSEHVFTGGLKGENLVIAGSGLIYAEISGMACAHQFTDSQIDSCDMLTLVHSDPENHLPIEPHLAQPVYLRDSVAWKKRQRIRS